MGPLEIEDNVKELDVVKLKRSKTKNIKQWLMTGYQKSVLPMIFNIVVYEETPARFCAMQV